MKRVLIASLKVIIAFTIAHGIYFLVAYLTTNITINDVVEPEETRNHIFIKCSNYHSSIMLPFNSISEDLKNIDTSKIKYEKKVTYVRYGWADKDYYLLSNSEEEISSYVFLKAIYLPTSSVVCINYENYLPNEEYEEFIKIDVTKEQFRNIEEHILASFSINRDGVSKKVDNPNKGAKTNAYFFDSVLSYHYMYLCNDWTNEALKKAGIRTVAWSPFGWTYRKALKKIYNPL